MFKVILVILSIVLSVNASEYSRANAAAKDAFKDLDCDFGDCPKEQKVIIKEKIVTKEVPIVVEKEVIVEKVVYRDRPVQKEVVSQVEPKAVTEVVYNKAYFDVHAKSQAPMLDYISYSNRGSFNIEQFVDTVNKIKERDTRVYIHGKIAVPSSITTSQVYMNVGQKYHFNYYNSWKKDIYYNNSKTAQNSDYFLVDVKEDDKGNRYVDYKIDILLKTASGIKASEENVAPNTYAFQMAPKVRGFKNKFAKAKIYIDEE